MRSCRWIIYLIGLIILFHGGDACCSDLVEDHLVRSGPIPIVNQAPIQLLFLHAVPDRAETLPKGRGIVRLNTTITNTLLSETSGTYAGVVDIEMIRTSLEFQFGLHPRLELGVALPFVYSYSGFMDEAILDVEQFFGNARNLREIEEQYRYSFRVEKDGRPFIGGRKRSTGVGDLVLRLKGQLLEATDSLPYLSSRIGIKLPTGDEGRALGSGKPDIGFGLLFQKDINRLTAYLNADVIFPGDAFDTENVSVHEFYSLMLGGEYRFTPQLSAMAQLRYTSRPFEDTGLEMLDRRIYDLLLGVNYRTKGGAFIQGGGIEDFYDSGDAGADITFFLNIGKYF